MTDSDLKNLLLESDSIRPGQEQRAWAALRDRLYPAGAHSRAWLFLPTWRSLGYLCLGLFLATAVFGLNSALHPARHALVFADSESPGIYATSFYSDSAQAQVVWLNGMEPASDQPTYLDPTTVIRSGAKAGHPPRSPNRL
jgi:hypothetical protein